MDTSQKRLLVKSLRCFEGGYMRGFSRQNAVTKWARFALKCGLLLTDAKMWTSISEELQDRADEVGNEVRRRYEDQADRLHEARKSLQGRSNWVSPTINFLGGIGLGLGLGVLFAPVSGEEARTALREKVGDIKNDIKSKVSDIATRSRSNTVNSPATGTSGD
jgi:gas vesicle protein